MAGSDPRRAGPVVVPRTPLRGRRQISVGVVDTVPLFRDGIAAHLDRTPWVRLAAQSASQQGALLMAEQLNPDVVVIDSGLTPNAQLIQVLTCGESTARIVVMVRETDRNAQFLANAMAAGAHAAVLRSAEPHRVLDAIRHAHRSHRYLDPTLTSLVTSPNGKPPQPVPVPDDADAAPARTPLSRREYQVLQLIAEGMENAAIAKVLFLSVETVRTHVKSILRKLAARDRTHAVAIGFRTGLLAVTAPAAPQRDRAPAPTR